MSNEKNLPEGDADLRLAKQYGEVRKSGKSESELDDPLIRILSAARDEDQNRAADIPVRGQERSWTKIQQAISESAEEKSKNAKIFSLQSGQKWYWVAAAILLIAFSSILLIQQSFTGPELIAEAGTTVTAVELKDGSNVKLRPKSKLYQLAATPENHEYSLTGEALFEVQTDPERTFSVEAGNGRVVVTGTRFNLSDRDQRSATYLIEGSVIFETTDRDQSVQLSSGEAAVISPEGRLLEPFTFEADEITGWTENRLNFRERTAASILAELEFHFNITIEAPEETKQEVLGGSIPLESAEQSLNDLSVVLGGRFVQTGENSYEFRSEE